MRVVFAVAVLLFSALTLAAGPAKDNQALQLFLKASEQCFKEKQLPQSYKAQFDKFEYPAEPIVYEYLHCLSLKTGLWDDATGYKVEQIANLYKDRAKIEDLIPILKECNKNANQDPAPQWAYRAFNCISNSRIGGWLKEDVKTY